MPFAGWPVSSQVWTLSKGAALSGGRQQFTRWTYEQFLPLLWDRWDVKQGVEGEWYSGECQPFVTTGPLLNVVRYPAGVDIDGLLPPADTVSPAGVGCRVAVHLHRPGATGLRRGRRDTDRVGQRGAHLRPRRRDLMALRAVQSRSPGRQHPRRRAVVDEAVQVQVRHVQWHRFAVQRIRMQEHPPTSLAAARQARSGPVRRASISGSINRWPARSTCVAPRCGCTRCSTR